MQSISFSKKLMLLQIQWLQQPVSLYSSSQQGFKSLCSLIGCQLLPQLFPYVVASLYHPLDLHIIMMLTSQDHSAQFQSVHEDIVGIKSV